MKKTEQRNRQTKTVERNWSIPAPLTSFLAKRTQESIGQSRDQEQFLGVVPGTFRFADFTRFTKMAYSFDSFYR